MKPYLFLLLLFLSSCSFWQPQAETGFVARRPAAYAVSYSFQFSSNGTTVTGEATYEKNSSRTRVFLQVFDEYPDGNAFVVSEAEVQEDATGTIICSNCTSSVMREFRNALSVTDENARYQLERTVAGRKVTCFVPGGACGNNTSACFSNEGLLLYYGGDSCGRAFSVEAYEIRI